MENEKFFLPSELLTKMKLSKWWEIAWRTDLAGEAYTTAFFKTRNGELLHLLIDKMGGIKNQFVSGELDGPRSPQDFQFSPYMITALLAKRKVRTGWLPWKYRWEYSEIAHIE